MWDGVVWGLYSRRMMWGLIVWCGGSFLTPNYVLAKNGCFGVDIDVSSGKYFKLQ